MIEIRTLVLDDDLTAVTSDLTMALKIFSPGIKIAELRRGKMVEVNFSVENTEIKLIIDPRDGEPDELIRQIEKDRSDRRFDIVLLDDHWRNVDYVGQTKLLGPIVNHIRGPASLRPIDRKSTRLNSSH